MKFFRRKKNTTEADSVPDKDQTDSGPEVETNPEAGAETITVAEPVTNKSTAPDKGGADGKSGVFSRLKRGLSRTSEQLAAGVGTLLLGRKEIDAALLEDLESELLMADVTIMLRDARLMIGSV